METLAETGAHPYSEELSRLFYSFRMAQLNRRYYSERFHQLRLWDKAFQAFIALSTAASFALLAFTDFSHVKLLAAILSVIAFMIATVVPALGLTRNIDNISARTYAWHYATQQIENALRRVKNAADPAGHSQQPGEVRGWVESAEEAYHQAAATPDTDHEDRKLLKRVEDEINTSFPPEYVWTAF
jgi:hypothetical protein